MWQLARSAAARAGLVEAGVVPALLHLMHRSVHTPHPGRAATILINLR